MQDSIEDSLSNVIAKGPDSPVVTSKAGPSGFDTMKAGLSDYQIYGELSIHVIAKKPQSNDDIKGLGPSGCDPTNSGQSGHLLHGRQSVHCDTKLAGQHMCSSAVTSKAGWSGCDKMKAWPSG